MKLNELKKVIKQSVKEAIQEEMTDQEKQLCNIPLGISLTSAHH